jgi:hypothetical protein
MATQTSQKSIRSIYTMDYSVLMSSRLRNATFRKTRLWTHPTSAIEYGADSRLDGPPTPAYFLTVSSS